MIIEHTLFSMTVALVSGIAAFFFIKNNKTIPGIIFSLLFGSAGGFIAVNTVNKNFSNAVIINSIFNICIWIPVWSAAIYFGIPGLIFPLIIFVLILTAGKLSIDAPPKIMWTVNISVSVLTAAALIPATIFKFNDILFSGSTLLLTGFMPLIILLPNFVLFIGFRKHRKPHKFQDNIIRSAFLFLLHIPTLLLMIIYFTNFFIRF